MLRDELIVCTDSGDITRLNWSCEVNANATTHVKDIEFSHSLQQSKGKLEVISLVSIATYTA